MDGGDGSPQVLCRLRPREANALSSGSVYSSSNSPFKKQSCRRGDLSSIEQARGETDFDEQFNDELRDRRGA